MLAHLAALEDGISVIPAQADLTELRIRRCGATHRESLRKRKGDVLRTTAGGAWHGASRYDADSGTRTGKPPNGTVSAELAQYRIRKCIGDTAREYVPGTYSRQDTATALRG